MRPRTFLRGTFILTSALGSGLPISTQAREGANANVVALDNAARRLVEQLTADRALVLARERRLADEREAKRLDELADQDTELRAAEKQVNLTTQALQKIRRDRDALAKKRMELTEQLLQRDRQLAAEVNAYRESVGEIANDSPEKRAALQRYADGDRVGASSVLKEITDAENRARSRAASVASAANSRKLGPLWLDMKDRGEKTTSDVIRFYREVTDLDPGLAWDWITLTDLYKEAGNLGMAQQAARLSAALTEQLAKANPTSAAAQRDVAVSHYKLATLTSLKSHWQMSAQILHSLKSQGRLAPTDEPWLAEATRQATGQP